MFQTHFLDSAVHMTVQSRRCVHGLICRSGSNVDVEFKQMMKKKTVTHEKSCPSVTPDRRKALLMSLAPDTCHGCRNPAVIHPHFYTEWRMMAVSSVLHYAWNFNFHRASHYFQVLVLHPRLCIPDNGAAMNKNNQSSFVTSKKWEHEMSQFYNDSRSRKQMATFSTLVNKRSGWCFALCLLPQALHILNPYKLGPIINLRCLTSKLFNFIEPDLAGFKIIALKIKSDFLGTPYIFYACFLFSCAGITNTLCLIAIVWIFTYLFFARE